MQYNFRAVFVITALFSLLGTALYGQVMRLPYFYDTYQEYDRFLNQKSVTFHTSIKPYIETEVTEVVDYDSLMDEELGTRAFIEKRKHPKTWGRMLNTHQLYVRKNDYFLYADFLFDWQAGYDLSGSSLLTVNTRGAMVGGDLGKRISFNSGFYENQTRFPDYVDRQIVRDTMVPGQGVPRRFKGEAVDFTSAFGHISISGKQWFNVQFGHGKNFFGDGYRSLLLSDNSFFYPYLKLTTTVWKLKYVNLWTQFTDNKTLDSYEFGYGRKWGSFHYLSYAIHPRFEVGLFEAIIWQDGDSTGRRGIDVNYLNPIIFFRPIQLSLGSPDNGLLGVNMKFKLFDHTHLYAQGVMDDLRFSELKRFNGFYQQKLGFQFGMKAYQLFRVKNLFWQLEMNRVRPYTYAHKTPTQNYTHANQALAHPMGANFTEVVNMLSYRYKRYFIRTKLIYARYGLDFQGIHAGKDIFRSDFEIPNFPGSYNNTVGQGLATDFVYGDVRLGVLFNTKLNATLEARAGFRSETSVLHTDRSAFFTVGFRTNLMNLYYDY